MLYSYINQGAGLAPLPKSEDLAQAIWIDLYHPTEEQVVAVAALGYDIPTLADMEEIEISNRLYTDNGTTYMTGVLPGQMPDGASTAMPVTFILNARRLVTVRHHNPRPFETFPTRADRSSCGTSSAERIFLGLIEEITGRLADLSEGVSKVLDTEATEVLSMTTTRSAAGHRRPAGRTGQPYPRRPAVAGPHPCLSGRQYRPWPGRRQAAPAARSPATRHPGA